MNEELMAFYQENGINPLGGCLPLLVQLPVFLVLFRVVQGITRHATDAGLAGGWAAGSASSGRTDVVQLNDDDLVFDPENLPVESDMYQDLIETNEMNFLGMDLSKTALDVVGENFLGALPYLALIVVVLVSSLVQQSRSEAATLAPDQPSAGNDHAHLAVDAPSVLVHDARRPCRLLRDLEPVSHRSAGLYHPFAVQR